ncbi:MAG: nucleoside-triphosphatase [Bacteroidales bacterium]|nr:nucleoside-triphosphatase [Bacteroidales bacterium]MDD4217201.1 nucleoside-triphosphatase [Bacteroidales bacterium]
MNSLVLNDKWIKASVIGTIWAASEIVFGSFLHNLKIPFSGHILTAIGLIILISAAFLWNEKGVIWRAGLICAIMKTMSPSAVIFGPMIAIFIEAILLEISILLLGKTYLGFIIGAVLAMSWNLVQKIISYIIFYGWNIIEIYKGLVKIAETQINIHFDLLWLPIIILLLSHAIFGILAALIGIKAGKINANKSYNPENIELNKNTLQKNQTQDIKHSTTWLITDIILIICGFLVLKFTSWYVWSFVTILIASVWIMRYRRALKKISKPKFWIIFAIITMLTVFVFSRLHSDENYLINGIIAGVQMNFRAIIIVLGFSVIAVELYNPKIRAFFSKTPFKQLPIALELATESLPDFIAALPDFKSAIKSPGTVFHSVLLEADARIKEISESYKIKHRVIIITGEKNEGKTSFIKDIISLLTEHKINFGGVLSAKQLVDNNCIGYDIVDIKSDFKTPFLQQGDMLNSENNIRWSIVKQGLEFGKQSLKKSVENNDVIIIDEIGLLELQNKGWSDFLNEIKNYQEKIYILTVRKMFVDDIISKYNLGSAVIINIANSNPTLIITTIKQWQFSY